MDIQHLRYFVEISKTGNLTKAAQNLYVSQPALSKTIQKMERELGVHLFEKQEHRLMLTDTGTVLLEKAQALLLEFDNIIQCIRDTENLKTGKITLGVPMLISFLYFCDIILDFKNQYPGVNMDIIEIGDDAIVEKVKEGSVDIGIVSRPLNGPELVSLPIFTDEVVAYIPKKNELSQQEYISFQDLEGQSLHMFSSDFSLYGQVVAGCQQAGFQPNISSTSSQRHFLIDMAQSTNGIALMPRPIVAKLTYPAMCIRPFVPKFPWTISIILKETNILPKRWRPC